MEYTDTVSGLIVEAEQHDQGRWRNEDGKFVRGPHCLNCGASPNQLATEMDARGRDDIICDEQLCWECYREEFGCDECAYSEGDRFCTGVCTAVEDQKNIEKARDELCGKILALLHPHYNSTEQAVVEKIVAG